jgi:hypothetical protein
LKLGSEVKSMVKYKCVKIDCPICHLKGSLQLFINRQGRITYFRVRHYRGKGKFSYCKIEKTNLDLLQNQGLQLPSALDQGHSGQNLKHAQHQIGQAHSSSKCFKEPPLGFEPRTFSLQG